MPGFVCSKNDWDWHYIGVEQLKRLYGVRHTDIIKVFDSCLSEDYKRFNKDGWLELAPDYNGDYYDIHAK